MKRKCIVWLPAILAAFYFLIFPFPAAARSTTLVIDEFKVADIDKIHEEYVIIKNVSENPLNFEQCVIKKAAAEQTDPTKESKLTPLFDAFGDYTLNPGDRVKISHPEYTEKLPFQFKSGTTLADNNSIILVCDDKTIDTVGYGKGAFWEGERIDFPKPGDVYFRVGPDTDNNYNDFKLFIKPLILDPNFNKILVIELMPSPSEGSEWIEIYNPTNLTVNLYGLKLCDGLGSTHCYSFGEEENISPFSYKTYEQSLTRITLNNTADSVQLMDANGNLISMTDEYEDAAKGESFSLFGSEWRWTKEASKGRANVFVTTIEEETEPKQPKSKKVKNATTKTGQKTEEDKDADQAVEVDQAVKGEKTEENENLNRTSLILGKKEIGFGLILLAALIVFGYTLAENKEKIYAAYNRISRRND
jgi:hypothetical protein